MFGKNKYKSLDKNRIREFNKIRNKEKRTRICHAPFSTLFFTEYGEILPCYYNKSIVFGNNKETSIENAWFGEPMEQLKKHLLHNDLSYGCQDCKMYLDLKNYYSVGAWKYDYLPYNNGKFPISLDFQISNVCNLSCIMCNGEFSQTVRQKRERKEIFINPYDDAFVEKLTPFIPHLKEAAFTGGEVFLIKIYYDIWDKIYELNPNVKISITTNGTILNTRVKSYLNKLNFNITLSIDSVDKENFEKIRRFSNFETVLQNLEYFKEYTQEKKSLFTIKICPMKQNWHEIPDIIRFINSKNISFLFNNVVFPPYTALWNLPSNKLKEIADFIEKEKFEINTETQKTNIERVKNLVVQLRNWQKASEKRETDFPDLENKSPEELCQMILQKVKEFITSNPDIPEFNEYGLEMKHIFELIFNKIQDKVILKNAFTYYFEMPVHRLISEFNIRNIDKIIDRTKQAGLTEPAEI